MQMLLFAPERAEICVQAPAPGPQHPRAATCEICGSQTLREKPCFFPLLGVWRVAVRCTGHDWKHGQRCPARWMEVTG